MTDLVMFKWYVIVGATLASIAMLIILFSDTTTYVPRTPDREAHDVSHPSSQAREIAEHLAADPVWVDPLVQERGSPLTDDGVRAAVADSTTPVFLLSAPDAQDWGGEADVLVQEVAVALAEDGLYAYVAPDGRITDHWVGEGHVSLQFHEEATPSRLRVGVLGVDSQVDAQSGDAGDDDTNPLMAGLVLGGVFAVPTWLVLKLIRRISRRRPRYLVGFR